MKKIILLLCMLPLFSGCSSDKAINYYSDSILEQNNITDVLDHFETLDVMNDSTEMVYYANRKNKEWFALFNKETKKLKQEWYGADLEYDLNEPHLSISGGRFCKKINNGYITEFYDIFAKRQLYKLLANGQIQIGKLDDDYKVLDALDENKLLVYENGNYSLRGFNGEDYNTNRITTFIIDNNVHLIGFKDNKIWVAINQNGIFTEKESSVPHEMKHKIHLGYGEYQEISTDRFRISSKMCFPEWGLALINCIAPNYHEIICINQNDINYIGIDNPEGENIINWYKGSILVHANVISSDATIIKKLKTNPLVMDSNCYPISYEECIYLHGIEFVRQNLSTGNLVWRSSISNTQNDARVSLSTPKKNGVEWTYNCQIVNKDGSKKNLNLILNIENGSLKIIQ